MASIILSFVGSQDPYSKKDDEGPFATLVKHLYQEKRTIKKIILLYTEDFQQKAIDTKDWFLLEFPEVPANIIELIPVAPALSEDPINQLLAVQESRKAVNIAKQLLTPEDTLELNGSSGTPAMKSSWSILQASGYTPSAHLWQVRNPNEMKSGQTRVFKNDVNVLKNEFDLQIIQQQIQDYNYSGAIVTLQRSYLDRPVLSALLHYAYYRLTLNFDRAFLVIQPYLAEIDRSWLSEIALLRQKKTEILLREAYFNLLIRLKMRLYADFLVGLFRLQEKILDYLVEEKIGLKISRKHDDYEQSLSILQEFQAGNLYNYLKQNNVNIDRGINRYTYQTIVSYHPHYSQLVPLIDSLNSYCSLRNEYIHSFRGVSQIEDEDKLLANLRKLMQQITSVPDQNPFDRLNQDILNLLLNDGKSQ